MSVARDRAAVDDDERPVRARDPWRGWRAATSSLPVPVSPSRSTVDVGRRRPARARRRARASRASRRGARRTGRPPTARAPPPASSPRRCSQLRPTWTSVPGGTSVSTTRYAPTQVPLVLRRSRSRTAAPRSDSARCRLLTASSSIRTSASAPEPTTSSRPESSTCAPASGPRTPRTSARAPPAPARRGSRSGIVGRSTMAAHREGTIRAVAHDPDQVRDDPGAPAPRGRRPAGHAAPGRRRRVDRSTRRSRPHRPVPGGRPARAGGMGGRLRRAQRGIRRPVAVEVLRPDAARTPRCSAGSSRRRGSPGSSSTPQSCRSTPSASRGGCVWFFFFFFFVCVCVYILSILLLHPAPAMRRFARRSRFERLLREVREGDPAPGGWTAAPPAARVRQGLPGGRPRPQPRGGPPGSRSLRT